MAEGYPADERTNTFLTYLPQVRAYSLDLR